MIPILTLALSIHSSSQTRTNIFRSDPISEEKSKPQTFTRISPTRATVPSPARPTGNLPSYYLTGSRFAADEQNIILPSTKQLVTDGRLRLGEVYEADLKESIIAFAEGKTTIRAILKKGIYKGAVLIGEATLEKNSKRIVIDFKKARFQDSDDSVFVQGIALDSTGLLGLEGKLVSNEAKYMTAEIAAAAAAGAADATINRSQTAFGNYQEQPGSDTIVKKTLVSALTQSATRASEKLRKVDEYVEINAPITIKVLITE